MIDVGFLGCGFIARYHAMQLALAPSACRIVACHDPEPGRAERFSREVAESMGTLGTPAACESVDDVLGRVDAVFVCTWTAAHRPLVEAAVSRGLPVFCEKPLGVGLTDAGAVAGALSRSPVHAVGLVLRSSPAMWAVRELIGDPAAGRVMNIVFRDDQYLPVGGMYESQWRADAARAGSGTLLEHSIHDVDLLEWLAGPIDSVAASQAFFHGLDGVEDSVTAMGAFSSGASFSLTSVWHDVLARPSLRRIEVFCERRLVTLQGDVFGPVSMQSDDESIELEGDGLADWLSARGVELRSTEEQFLEAVGTWRGGGRPARVRPDAADALRAHRIVDAMYSSAGLGGASVSVADGAT